SVGERRDGFEQIEGAEAVNRKAIPQRIVAAGPDNPHVAALDLLLRKGALRPAVDDIEVHVVEVIVAIAVELRRGYAATLRFDADGAGLRFSGRTPATDDESGRKKDRRTH